MKISSPWTWKSISQFAGLLWFKGISLNLSAKGLHLVHFPFHYIGNRKGSCTEEHVLLPIQKGMGFHTCFQSKLKTTRGIHPPFKRFFLSRTFSTIFKISFLNLFMALLGIHCCTVFSLVEVSGGYSTAMLWLIIVVASLIVEHGLWGTRALVVATHGLSSCGFWALGHGLNSYGPCGIVLDQGSNPCLLHC